MSAARLIPALTAVAVALAPAAARASHQHDLQLDKQEIFQTVPAGGIVTTARASCSSGYRVLSGSIRVDTVPGGSLTSIRVRTSAPDSTSDSRWFYELVNTAPAGNQDAQIKLMISCIKPTTTGGSGNQHTLTWNRVDNALSVPAGLATDSSQSIDCDTTTATDPFSYIPSGAGWVFDPDTGYRQLAGLLPSVAQVTTNGKWFPTGSQHFFLAGDASQAAYTLYATAYCLKHLTDSAFGESSNHQHYLNVSQQTVAAKFGRTTSSNYYSQSVSCPSGTYAVAPTWYIEPAALATGLRIVGIGYQGDQDVFRVVNPGGSSSFVSFGAICLGTKTSFTNQPTVGAGPGAQKLLFAERSVKATIAPGATLDKTLGCAEKTDFVTAAGLSGSGASRLEVVRSGGGPKPTKWPFVLRNRSGRTAAISLHAKCLSPWAQGHTLVIDALPSQAPDGVSSCPAPAIAIRPSTEGDLVRGARYSCLNRFTTTLVNHHHRLRAQEVAADIRRNGTLTCAKGSDAIVPRVAAAKGAHLVSSVPSGRRWAFRFEGGAGASHVRVTCLAHGTTPEVAQPVTAPVVEAPPT